MLAPRRLWSNWPPGRNYGLRFKPDATKQELSTFLYKKGSSSSCRCGDAQK